MKCLGLIFLLNFGTNYCKLNNQKFESIGFNYDKTTLIVKCKFSTIKYFNYFDKSNQCLWLKQ